MLAVGAGTSVASLRAWQETEKAERVALDDSAESILVTPRRERDEVLGYAGYESSFERQGVSAGVASMASHDHENAPKLRLYIPLNLSRRQQSVSVRSESKNVDIAYHYTGAVAFSLGIEAQYSNKQVGRPAQTLTSVIVFYSIISSSSSSSSSSSLSRSRRAAFEARFPRSLSCSRLDRVIC